MKTLLWAIATVVLLPTSARTQTWILLEGGLNIANQSDPGSLVEGTVWSPHVGFLGGVSATFTMYAGITIESGIRFVQKGLISDWSTIPTGSVHAILTSNYLDVPIYVGIGLVDFGPQLCLIAGPAFSYLLSAHSDAIIQNMGHFSLDRKSWYYSYDATLDGGLRLTRLLSDKYRLQLTGLYSLGVVKLDTHGSNEKTRDIRIALGIGYAP